MLILHSFSLLQFQIAAINIKNFLSCSSSKLSIHTAVLTVRFNFKQLPFTSANITGLIHCSTSSDLSSIAAFDVLSGSAATPHNNINILKVVHEIINAISWGLLLPWERSRTLLEPYTSARAYLVLCSFKGSNCQHFSLELWIFQLG
ncbi:hypothetical protein DITRI_Ditri13aG0136900 [Diplodiscus trichospermus]